MDEIILQDEWVDAIAPYHPSNKRGHPPIDMKRILRMYLVYI
ncbi:MAG: hypothetical protein ABF904_01305 [Ethanoligenens sp.]